MISDTGAVLLAVIVLSSMLMLMRGVGFFRSLTCKHKWSVVTCTVVSGKNYQFTAGGCMPLHELHHIERTVAGRTTYTLQCIECGRLARREHPGEPHVTTDGGDHDEA